MSGQLRSEGSGMKQARRMMAADWLQRVNSDSISDEELKEWLEWYSQNEDNRRAFDQAEIFFRTLRTASARDKEILRQLADSKANETTSPYGRQWSRWAAAAILIVGVAGTLTWLRSVDRGDQSTQQYQTRRGEHRTINLPDGSTAVIGAQSAMESTFDDKRRAVTVVSGEAYFQVKRDRTRPFVVRAGPAQITALGTAFDIHRSGDRVAVAVTNGSVEVTRIAGARGSSVQPESLRVAAGQRAVVTADPLAAGDAQLKVMPIDPEATLAWQAGQLSFSGEPLSVVIESINRYTDRQVTIADTRVARMTFTGTVLPDRVEEWVMNLSQAFPLETAAREDGTFVLKSRGGNLR